MTDGSVWNKELVKKEMETGTKVIRYRPRRIERGITVRIAEIYSADDDGVRAFIRAGFGAKNKFTVPYANIIAIEDPPPLPGYRTSNLFPVRVRKKESGGE